MKSIWRLSVVTTAEAEDAVTELLAIVSGQPASSFLDAETRRVIVSAYFAKKPADAPGLLSALRQGLDKIRKCGLDPAPAKITLVKIPRERWAHSWKRHFKALEIGSALLIKPSWVHRKAKPGQQMVVLDPGLSFGTGQHPTTGFCLRQIVSAHTTNPNLSLLDIGTGSGILAISAAKLDFAPIHAFDFDTESIRVARANARKNGVARKLKIVHGDLTKMPQRSKIQYDVVCANLISTLLIEERKRIVSRVKPGGILILAGILAREFHEVQQAFEEIGLKLRRAKSDKEWRSGSYTLVDHKNI